MTVMSVNVFGVTRELWRLTFSVQRSTFNLKRPLNFHIIILQNLHGVPVTKMNAVKAIGRSIHRLTLISIYGLNLLIRI